LKRSRRQAGAALVALVTMAMPAAAQDRSLPLHQLRSGLHFAGEDVKALQQDAGANPAQLWLEQGRQRWATAPAPDQRACANCHGALSQMKGVALKFPRVQAATGRLVNLDDQVQHCQSQHQNATPAAYESDALLALTMAITEASNGLPLQTALTPELQPHWQQGEELFKRRQGQLNLSCANCHDQHWGRRLFTDTLSQGQPNGYPLYRLEWQQPGSLERRLRSCLAGIRAEVPAWGNLGLRQLSLYLMWRGQGLPVEVPAVRK
jgi:L-cysteine S-thiosulfotransferase